MNLVRTLPEMISIRSKCQVEIAETRTRTTKPSLKRLGYTRAQRIAILSCTRELQGK